MSGINWPCVDNQMSITLKQIRTFLIVARSGNTSTASHELLMTQSAISMSLQELERQLGGQLFDRRPGNKLHLNDRGRLLFSKGKEIIERVEELETVFTQTTGNLKGHLLIGASSTTGIYLVPTILGNYLKTERGVTATLTVGNTEAIVNRVADFSLDVGFIEGPCVHRSVDVYPWMDDTLGVVVAANHPLASKKKITIDDLAKADWILRERGSGTRQISESMLLSRLERINVFLELGHTEAIKNAVEQGLGISCLSMLAVKSSIDAGRLVCLNTPFLSLKRPLSIIMQKDKYRSHLMESFAEFCRSQQPT